MFGRTGALPVSRIEGVSPDVFAPPRPGLWWRRTALLAVVLLLASAAGWGIYTIVKTCGGLGSGMHTVEGQCVGITDGSYRFYPDDPQFESVQKKIEDENKRVRDAGRPYVKVALLAPLTAADNGPVPKARILHGLQGAHVAQRRLNSGQAGDFDIPEIELLLANEGSHQEHWLPVVEQIDELTRDENPLVAVIGLGSSLPGIEQTIDWLAAKEIPMVGTGAATDLLSEKRGFVRVVPNTTDYVDALAGYLQDEFGAEPRPAFLVYDGKTEDPFPRDLKRNFIDTLLHTGRLNLVGDEEWSFDGRTNEARDPLFGQAVSSICDDPRPDVVLFAGREIDLRAFVDRLAGRNCPEHPVRILTAGGGFGTILDKSDLLEKEKISVVHAAPVDTIGWGRGDVGTPGGFKDFSEKFNEYIGGDFTDNPFYDASALMYHDALLVAAQAIGLAGLKPDSAVPATATLQVRASLPNIKKVSGASGTICFGSESGSDPRNKLVPVLTIPDPSEQHKAPYVARPDERCTG